MWIKGWQLCLAYGRSTRHTVYWLSFFMIEDVWVKIEVQKIDVCWFNSFFWFYFWYTVLCSFLLWSSSSTHYSRSLFMSSQLFFYFHLYLLKQTHLTVLLRRLTFDTNSTIVAKSVTSQKGGLRLYKISRVLCSTSYSWAIIYHII